MKRVEMKKIHSQGFILPFTLMILLIAAFFSITALRQASNQNRQAAHSSDILLAQQRAMVGLSEAERLIQSWQNHHEPLLFTAECNNGLCSNHSIHSHPRFQSQGQSNQLAWQRNQVFPPNCPSQKSRTVALAASTARTHFIIEYLGLQTPNHIFRISVRACGKQTSSEFFTQKIVLLTETEH